VLETFTARLADIEIFRGLSEESLTEIARSAERMVFRAGHRILTRHAPGDAAYIIMGGDAVALDPDGPTEPERPLAEGTMLGELAMLIDHAYGVTVIARGNVRCLKLSRDSMLRHMAKRPELADHFVSRITSRLTRVAVEMRRIDQILALAADMQRPA
jgi:CRP-like cAMP-binding protein